MLTEAEIEWLERRKVLCTHCDLSARGFCGGGKNKLSCQLWEDQHLNNPVKRYKAFQDMQDAAEFEARVAEKLARDICFRCPDRYNEICPKGIGYFRLKLGIASCGMKHARLAAEEEMESSK